MDVDYLTDGGWSPHTRQHNTLHITPFVRTMIVIAFWWCDEVHNLIVEWMIGDEEEEKNIGDCRTAAHYLNLWHREMNNELGRVLFAHTDHEWISHTSIYIYIQNQMNGFSTMSFKDVCLRLNC